MLLPPVESCCPVPLSRSGPGCRREGHLSISDRRKSAASTIRGLESGPQRARDFRSARRFAGSTASFRLLRPGVEACGLSATLKLEPKAGGGELMQQDY